MQPIPLEPGMRVRCVDASVPATWATKLTEGREYAVLGKRGRNGCIEIRDDSGTVGGWFEGRFKPVVRVKAPTRRIISDGPFRGMPEADAMLLLYGGY